MTEEITDHGMRWEVTDRHTRWISDNFSQDKQDSASPKAQSSCSSWLKTVLLSLRVHSATGSVNENVLPLPSSLVTPISPPWASTSSRVMYNPSPMPSARRSPFRTVEAFEEVGDVVGMDAVTLVNDADAHGSALLLYPDMDGCLRGGVFLRVG